MTHKPSIPRFFGCEAKHSVGWTAKYQPRIIVQDHGAVGNEVTIGAAGEAVQQESRKQWLLTIVIVVSHGKQ